MTTTRPSDTHHLDSIIWGSDDRKGIKVAADAPISETLMTQVNYTNSRHNPLVTSPIGDDFDSEDIWGGRIAVRYLPTDTTVIDYSYDITREDQKPKALMLSFATSLPGYNDDEIEPFIQDGYSDTYLSDGTNNFQTLNIDGHSLIISHDVESIGA